MFGISLIFYYFLLPLLGTCVCFVEFIKSADYLGIFELQFISVWREEEIGEWRVETADFLLSVEICAASEPSFLLY